MTAPARPPALELSLLLALSTLWGASYTFIRIGVETIPPLTLITARTAIAGALLVGLLRWRGARLPCEPAMWGRFLFQACLNSVVPFTLIAWAERTTPAGLAAILNSTSPIFAFLMTTLVTRHEPAGLHKLVGVLLGMAGALLIVGEQAIEGIGQPVLAQIALLAASACYAAAAIFGTNFRMLDPAVPAAGSMICGAAILIPLSLLIDQPWTLRPSTASVLALLALATLSTALAFLIYFRLLRTLGSMGTTAQAYLRVPIGVGIGAVALGESLPWTAWVGLAGVAGGVALMTRKR